MGSRGFGATYGINTSDNLSAGNVPYSSKQSFFAWVWRQDGAALHTIMGQGTGFFAAGPFQILYYDNTQGAYSFVRSFSTLNGKWIGHTATDFSSGGWHTVGFSYDDGSSTNDAVMYLNGDQTIDRVTAPVGTSNTLAGQPMFLGNAANGSFGLTWAGMIGYAVRWNVLLTAGEFYGLANGNDPLAQRGGPNPFLVRPQNIINHWPIWGQNSPEPDFAAGANNLTLNGTAPQFGPPLTLFSRMFWGPQIFVPSFGRPRSWAGVMG